MINNFFYSLSSLVGSQSFYYGFRFQWLLGNFTLVLVIAKAAKTASTFERHYYFSRLVFLSLSMYINLVLMGFFLTKVRVRYFLFRCVSHSFPSLASPATVTKLSRSLELSRMLSRARGWRMTDSGLLAILLHWDRE